MSYQLTIEPLGETIEILETQTMLDACLRHGIFIPYACGHGLCSTCKVRVIDGEVDLGDASAFALMDFERDEGAALACCARVRSDATIEADVEVDADAQCHPIRDVTGTIAALAKLTPDIMRVELRVPPGFAFQAGQYVNIEFPGCDAPRAFSIANAPSRTDRLEFHIRLVPGGIATTHVHQRLAVGDALRITGPFGRFFVRTSAPEPVLLIAGGSGLSSIKSMALDLLERGDGRRIWLFHGVRTSADVYDDALFEDLAAKHPHFSYVPALSQAAPGDGWSGETGFIHEVLERRFDGNFKGFKAYVCGPPPMIEAVIRALMRGRLFERDIFTERFVTQSDGEAALARTPLFKRL